MRVLVACEESQAVTKAFRAKGHEAYSCDIQQCALYDHIEWHIVEDARKLINGNCCFETVNGEKHKIKGGWDLLIAHPPCTYLTSCGSKHLLNNDHTVKSWDRYMKAMDAKEFFMMFLNAECKHICVENPAPIKMLGLPKYTQIIEPYMFGDPWKKRTCLWLKGLEPLQPDKMVQPLACWVSGAYKSTTNRTKLVNTMMKPVCGAKKRSKTFPGIARAMAEQWGGEENALDIGCT